MQNMYENQRVVDLLSKLKHSDGGYPSDMLDARRRTYIKQMVNVGLGIGVGAGLNKTAKGGGNSATATTTVTSKVLEIALITAIAMEAGTAAYLYRDKIANKVRSYFSAPMVQDVSSSSSGNDSSTSLILNEAIGTPSITISETPVGTPSATPSTHPPSTSVSGDNNQTTNSNQNNSNQPNTNSNVNANATPNPNGNNGNHYGQTPRPERTKENNDGGGGNNNVGDGGNNNGEGNGDNNGGGNNGRP
jgi:hypothetical protein